MYDTWPHAKFELDRTNGSGDTARGSARAHVQKHVGLVLWVRHDRMYGIWPHAEVDQNRSSRSRDIVTPCSETLLTRHVQALLQHIYIPPAQVPHQFQWTELSDSETMDAEVLRFPRNKRLKLGPLRNFLRTVQVYRGLWAHISQVRPVLPIPHVVSRVAVV